MGIRQDPQTLEKESGGEGGGGERQKEGGDEI